MTGSFVTVEQTEIKSAVRVRRKRVDNACALVTSTVIIIRIIITTAAAAAAAAGDDDDGKQSFISGQIVIKLSRQLLVGRLECDVILHAPAAHLARHTQC